MVKPGYKQTEMGVIPEDWCLKTLKTIAPLQRGFDLPYSKMEDGKYPVVFSNGIGAYHAQYMVKGPGVVTGRSGTIGKIHYVDNNYWPHNTALWVTSFCGNYPKYIFYLFNTINWELYNSGSGVPTLNRNDVHDLKCAIPSFEEQQHIAEALSDVDNMISSLEKLIAKKKAVKQGAMQELLTGKKRLPGFTGEWHHEPFGKLCTICRGGSPRPIQDYLTTSDSGINWIKIGDVEPNAKYITYTQEKIIESGVSMSRRVYKGDFILSNSMSFGRPYILKIDGCIHDGWLAIQEYQKTFDTDFLYYLLGSAYVFEQYIQMAAGSSVQNLNKDKVAKLDVFVPPMEEQSAIASILSDMDNEIEALEQKLAKTRQLKQGMMQQLLTGKIRLV